MRYQLDKAEPPRLGHGIKRVKPIKKKKMHQSRNPNLHRSYSTSPYRHRSTSPRRRHSTSPRQRGNSNTNQQWDDNSGFNSETSKTKLARPWFHKPLCSRKQLKNVGKEFREISLYEWKNWKRCFGCGFQMVHPIMSILHGITILIWGYKNKIDFSVSVTSFLLGVFYFLQYFDDVDKLFTSIFEIGDKSITAYCADPVIIELFLNGIRVAGLIYQLVNRRQHIMIITFGIVGVISYFAGNILLIGQKGLPDSTINDSAPDSDSHVSM